MRLTGLRLLALSLFSAALPAASSIFSLSNIRDLAAQDPRKIEVWFTGGESLLSADVTDPRSWRVTVFYSSKSAKSPAQLTISNPPIIAPGSSGALIDVTAGGHVDSDWNHVTVVFLGSVGASVFTLSQSDYKKEVAGRTKMFNPASGKSDADVYFSGSWAPAVTGPTVYNIDSNLALSWALNDTYSSFWYVGGNVQTSNAKKVDPGSFRWQTGWKYVPKQTVAPMIDLGTGMEFDRSGSVVNFLVSPRATWSLEAVCSKLYVPGLMQCPDAGDKRIKPAIAWEFDVIPGMELGRELKDPLRFTAVHFPGTGMVLRGAPEARLYINFLKISGLKQLTSESDYDVRALARPEVFLETRLGTSNPVPVISQRTRQHVANITTAKITDAFGVTLKFEYGALPPAYTFVDRKFTLGLTYQLKQNSHLRP